MKAKAGFWPIVLWIALGVQKVAGLAVVVALGRIGGTESLGVHASLATVCGLAGALLHLGLPDWVMYRAADARSRRARVDGESLDDVLGARGGELGGGHGIFLISAVLAYGGCVGAVPWLVETRALRPFALLVIASLFLPHLSAYSLSTLRGLAAPKLEALGQLGSAVLLTAVVGGALSNLVTGGEPLLARSPGGALAGLGAGLTIAAVPMLLPFFWGARSRELGPRFGELSRLPHYAAHSLPYVALSILWMVLWAADVIAARTWSSSAEVGLLRTAVLVIHGGLFGAALFGTLLIHRVKAGAPGSRAAVIGLGAALAIPAVAVSWLAAPFLAEHFGTDVGALRAVMLVATFTAPLSYTATLWMPIAIAQDAGRVRAALVVALAVAAAVAFLTRSLGARGALVTLAAGQAVMLFATMKLVLAGSAARPVDSANSHP